MQEPESTSKKKRGLQSRDLIAARLKQQGDSLGSGRTYDRTRYVVKVIDELRSKGQMAEAEVLADTLNTCENIRGTYEIVRLGNEALLALCHVVMAGEAPNLLAARKLVSETIQQRRGIEERPIALIRAKGGLYRLTSRRNRSSVLLSAQDLIELSELLQCHMGEFQQKAGEVPGTSSGET